MRAADVKSEKLWSVGLIPQSPYLQLIPEAVLCGWARGLWENLVREIRRNNVKPSDKASPRVCTSPCGSVQVSVYKLPPESCKGKPARHSPCNLTGFFQARDPGFWFQRVRRSQMVKMCLHSACRMQRGRAQSVARSVCVSFVDRAGQERPLLLSYLIKPSGIDRGELGVERSASPLSLLLCTFSSLPSSLSPALSRPPPSQFCSRL